MYGKREIFMHTINFFQQMCGASQWVQVIHFVCVSFEVSVEFIKKLSNSLRYLTIFPVIDAFISERKESTN